MTLIQVVRCRGKDTYNLVFAEFCRHDSSTISASASVSKKLSLLIIHPAIWNSFGQLLFISQQVESKNLSGHESTENHITGTVNCADGGFLCYGEEVQQSHRQESDADGRA